MKNAIRSPWLLIMIMVVILGFAAAISVNWSQYDNKKLDYSSFLQKVEEDEIQFIAINNMDLYGVYRDSQIKDMDTVPNRYDFYVGIPNDIKQFKDDVYRIVSAKSGTDIAVMTDADLGFEIRYDKAKEPSIWSSILPMLLMFAVIIGCWMWFMRQQNTRNSQFGKSRASMHMDENNTVTFDQVAGMDEEREELQEIVEFLREPKKFLEMGARIPKGVLLLGPPGTGKTLLAKATANEAGVRFFSISGSDFVEMYVGVGASRVRDLFETAKKYSPSIIFIDEIDAVGRQRGTGLGGGHDEREQTLNQLLVEMDGFSINEGVIVMAATNRSDILDPALLRPGRFDRQITVGLPDIKGREEILKVHAKGKPFAQDVDLSTIAKLTVYFTGADLENLLNEAALLATRKSHKAISMEDIEEAIRRVQAGPEKKSRVISNKEKQLTAFHEAGHAIVAHLLPGALPVHEVSIIPRGRAAGLTYFVPKGDMEHYTRSMFIDQIAVSLGGYAAEMLMRGDITTGASDDIKKASQIARSMITQFGMSEEVGPMFLGSDEEVFLGRDYGHARNYSEKMAALIDEEMRKLLDKCYETATRILTEQQQKLEQISQLLMDKEKIGREEFEGVMGRQPVEA